jgi:hypothetical protein
LVKILGLKFPAPAGRRTTKMSSHAYCLVNTPTPQEGISGLIERVTFHSEETGFAVLHVKVTGNEHIVVSQDGGRDDSEHLALACYHCNAHKGPNLSGLDPESVGARPAVSSSAGPVG